MYICYSCKEEIEIYDARVGRQDVCPKCMSYLHTCKNCKFWDPYAHNECIALAKTLIRDRDVANFCSAFQVKRYDEKPESNTLDAKTKLDSLFGDL